MIISKKKSKARERLAYQHTIRHFLFFQGYIFIEYCLIHHGVTKVDILIKGRTFHGGVSMQKKSTKIIHFTHRGKQEKYWEQNDEPAPSSNPPAAPNLESIFDELIQGALNGVAVTIYKSARLVLAEAVIPVSK
ncbi:hypothetical protein EDD18DRAFT_1106057 [Armillaria luteobubalina]|uniref:Uncharacterized protein n=1 Tax=Armillaria luteobubalina TaxID=153913 RepID=A0AA39Q4U5_9AGAR|nr:hypothetical protein EDD18DRAFT_1106057 [Armillaria luteobubalina]